MTTTCKLGHAITEDNAYACKDGRRLCRTCRKENARSWREKNRNKYMSTIKAWREKNPDRVRAIRLRVKYGKDFDYNALLTKQRGVCANTGCGNDGTESAHGRLIVDHCHDTGRVRGLLCNGCNVALGLAKEDPKRLAGLVEYAERLR